jgi:hypothetical protein
MVLSGANTTTFFEDAVHMGIPHETVIQLQQEGIVIVDDIADFDKDTIEQLAANLRRPAGRVPDPNQDGATIPTPPLRVWGEISDEIDDCCETSTIL